MKVKLLIIPCLFLMVLSFTANAQTKEEKERWIVEKINGLFGTKTYSYDQGYVNGERSIISYILVPLNFSIRDGNIIFAYNSTLRQYEKNKWVTYNTDKKNISAKINLLDKIVDVSYSNLKDAISGNETLHYGDAYLTIQLKCSCLKGLSNLEGKESLYVFPILLDKNAEPDLLNRLDKAFTLLKTFYQAPKETF